MKLNIKKEIISLLKENKKDNMYSVMKIFKNKKMKEHIRITIWFMDDYKLIELREVVRNSIFEHTALALRTNTILTNEKIASMVEEMVEEYREEERQNEMRQESSMKKEELKDHFSWYQFEHRTEIEKPKWIELTWPRNDKKK